MSRFGGTIPIDRIGNSHHNMLFVPEPSDRLPDTPPAETQRAKTENSVKAEPSNRSFARTHRPV